MERGTEARAPLSPFDFVSDYAKIRVIHEALQIVNISSHTHVEFFFTLGKTINLNLMRPTFI